MRLRIPELFQIIGNQRSTSIFQRVGDGAKVEFSPVQKWTDD
jgi:hypothetical protein